MNPDVEIVVQTYVPTPQRNGMFGGVDKQMDSHDAGRVARLSVVRQGHSKNPELAWLPRRVRRRIDEFETVMRSRWPTIQDIRLSCVGTAVAQDAECVAIPAWCLWPSVRVAAGAETRAVRQPRHESL